MRHLAPHVDAVVVVDVLSFTTCVDVAVSRGAAVLPYRWRDDASAFARGQGASLASHGRRFTGGYSLSPSSLLTLPAGERLVLPSPNGGTLCALAAERGVPVYAACLRSARAVGEHLRGAGRVLVVPAGDRSAEAEAAGQAFRSACADLHRTVQECSSGLELTELGFSTDIDLAVQSEVSSAVPTLRDGAFTAA